MLEWYYLMITNIITQVSRRGYYDWLNRSESRRSVENRELLEASKVLFSQHREVYGDFFQSQCIGLLSHSYSLF